MINVQWEMKNLIIGVMTIVLLAFSGQKMIASTTDPQKDSTFGRDSIADTLFVIGQDNSGPSPEETFRRKKLITCILAFPLPFGFVGMHRIYLGTEPWVPIVYLCTAGGGCGLLPLIDFLYLVTANEEEFKKYENNPKVFMFVE